MLLQFFSEDQINVILKIAKWIIDNYGFAELLGTLIAIFLMLFSYKFYTDRRKDMHVKNLVQSKEREIERIAGQLRQTRIELLMKDGHTFEEAKSIIYLGHDEDIVN